MTPELLGQLLQKHGAALELFASQWTGSPEDCVQEALLQLFRQRQPPRDVLPWLYRVVRNRAISMRRQADRRVRHEQAAGALRGSWFKDEAGNAWDAGTVTRALESLEEELREVVIARVWGGLSFEQIAEVVGTSRSTAHRRFATGLELLRERLEVRWMSENPCPN